jgi:hypothetical protein
MNRIKPGNAVVLRARSIKMLGVLIDPPPITVVLHLPDGTTQSGPAVRDSQGVYHCDLPVPLGTPSGVAVHRWQLTGAAVDANALAERKFIVDPLAF